VRLLHRLLLHRQKGQFSVTQPQSVRYRLGYMETRSRTRIRATNLPSREVTVDGTQAETEVLVNLSASATGHPGDGRISPRSTSLEAGPRRTYWPSTRSESASWARGSAQEVAEASYQGTAGLVQSHTAVEATVDSRQISTHRTCLDQSWTICCKSMTRWAQRQHAG